MEQIIFNILSNNPQAWVRYWKHKEISGMTLPGEYLEIRSHYLKNKDLQELFKVGFNIESICSKQINADSYFDILLKRNLTNNS